MNQSYNIARFLRATGGFDWNAFELALIAMRGVPTFVATDTTLALVLSHGHTQAGVSLAITGHNVLTDGTMQTDPVVIPGITAGADVTCFVMVKQAVILNNSIPLEFIDDAVGLPFVPNGLNLAIQPDWLAQRGWLRA